MTTRNAGRVALVAMLLAQIDRDNAGDRCRVCESVTRRATGECAMCGAYVCATCSKLHIGEATRECPGEGVEVPR